jgi:hypothetical protein
VLIELILLKRTLQKAVRLRRIQSQGIAATINPLAVSVQKTMEQRKLPQKQATPKIKICFYNKLIIQV